VRAFRHLRSPSDPTHNSSSDVPEPLKCSNRDEILRDQCRLRRKEGRRQDGGQLMKAAVLQDIGKPPIIEELGVAEHCHATWHALFRGQNFVRHQRKIHSGA
jgi:hypothetical protein